MDCLPAHIARRQLHFAGVDTRANPQSEGPCGTAHPICTPHGACGTVKQREEAVARGTYFPTAESIELEPQPLIVLREELPPGRITDSFRCGGRIDNVGEEQCGKDALPTAHDRPAEGSHPGKVDRDPRVVADYPSVVPRRDFEGLVWAKVQRRAVGHDDVEFPSDHIAEVVVFAQLGAGDRLDVLRPVPAGFEDRPAHHNVVQLEDLHAPARKRPHLVRTGHVLHLQSHHRSRSLGCTTLSRAILGGAAQNEKVER